MGAFRTWSMRFPGRLIGWAAAYALVLNVVLASLLGAQVAGHSTYDGSDFELCLSGALGGADPSAPAPQNHAIEKIHCLLCTAGGSVAALPAPAIAVLPALFGAEVVRVLADNGSTRDDPNYFRPPARGPPLTA